VASIPFVGLTGSIGAGKSEALAALERLGAATLSTDAVVRELLQSDEGRGALVERFGPEVAPGGTVDRDAVARLVFEQPHEREWLEGFLWPRVGERVASWREEIEALDPKPRAAVVEVPLLFESGMEGVFDSTVAVLADDELREQRAQGRGHVGVAGRASRQLSQQEKAERADYVVENDGTLDDLEAKLSALLATIGA
jgi:dephospho-CoA kinase